MSMNMVECIQWVSNVLLRAETFYTRVSHLKYESETYGAKGPGAVVYQCALSINESINKSINQ